MITALYALFSLCFAGLYGAVMLREPPGLTRTMVKALGVGALSIAAGAAGALILPLALFAYAVGDAFLAQKTKRSLMAGMGAFAMGHILLCVEFLIIGATLIADQDVARMMGQAGLFAGFLGSIVWLWPGLGAMRAPTIGYGALLTMMAALALGLPASLWPVALGAFLFLLSDAVLSAELFRWREDDPARAWSAPAVWILYYGGVALMAAGLLVDLQ